MSALLFVTTVTTVMTVMTASAATAAEIIDVRVGLHPTYTRIVFELDSAAGYQLSKGAPTNGGEELVVTLQATSIPRKVQAPRKSLLGLVRVAPQGRQAIVRIELKRKGLVVKERIMSSPYRVVLDFHDPTAAAPKPVAKPTPKPAPKPAPKPTPKPVAKPTPKPTPKPVAKPAPVPKPAPISKPAPIEPPAAKDEADDLLGATDDLEPGSRASAGGAPSSQSKPRSQVPPNATAEPSEGGIATMGQTDRVKPPDSKPLRQAQMAEEEGGGLGTLLMFAGVAALVGVGAFAVIKLRGGRKSDDDESDDDDAPNPFAGMHDGEEAASSDSAAQPKQAASPAKAGGPQLTLDSLVDGMPEGPPAEGDPVADPSLAQTTISTRGDEGGDDAFSLVQEGDGAATPSSTPSSTPTPTPTPTPAPPAATDGPTFADDDAEELGEEEMAKLIQQFEQRVAALESRLDEQAEARERLERQVAAQTEELRVQRAAIARTQRAVRNLTRGDEDGPTEPALRDPNG